jgi:hypothetical protein
MGKSMVPKTKDTMMTLNEANSLRFYGFVKKAV